MNSVREDFIIIRIEFSFVRHNFDYLLTLKSQIIKCKVYFMFYSLTEHTDKEKEQISFLLSKKLRDLKVLEYTDQFCECITIESVSSNDL